MRGSFENVHIERDFYRPLKGVMKIMNRVIDASIYEQKEVFSR